MKHVTCNICRENFLNKATLDIHKCKGDIIVCPECDQGVRINGKGIIIRHERGLAYVPYDLYRNIMRIAGTSVKEQAKKNLCPASGRKD